MIMQDLNHWAKACFELTDFNRRAVVSVVTNEYSDDANGCNIDQNFVWLQATRVDQSFAFHYSLDGKIFYMMRFFNLPVKENIKVGLLAQSPMGEGGIRTYESLSIERKTVKISEWVHRIIFFYGFRLSNRNIWSHVVIHVEVVCC